jgi:hypothetical protein
MTIARQESGTGIETKALTRDETSTYNAEVCLNNATDRGMETLPAQ